MLVNAAGILRSSHTHSTTLEAFQQVINVNLVGTFLMIREAIPALLEGNGSAVVNFSSTSAAFAHPYMAAYAASKGGVQSMTHALAAEYAKQGIRFNSVQPGSISSGMTDGSGESKQSQGPGLPEDADFSLFMKLDPGAQAGLRRPRGRRRRRRDARERRRRLHHRHRGAHRRRHALLVRRAPATLAWRGVSRWARALPRAHRDTPRRDYHDSPEITRTGPRARMRRVARAAARATARRRTGAPPRG